MNQEEQQAMCELDSRLVRLYRNLDASPGFDQRLWARIGQLEATEPRARQVAALARVEGAFNRERAAAGRDAGVESLVLGIAAIGGVAAVWQLAPMMSRWLEHTQTLMDPVWLGFGTLPVAAGVLWGLLRHFGVDARRLIGT